MKPPKLLKKDQPDYSICKSDDSDNLANIVRGKLEEGWELCGSVVVTECRATQSVLWAQAMVRK